jgi:predicted nucleic acid-binding protein
VIYLDTSVLLAQLLAEDRVPPDHLWDATLVSSRLVEYELRVRLNARGLGHSHAEPAALLLGRIAMLELAEPVLARAKEPFPTAVRTLDALHLASAHFLVEHGQGVQLASYDGRMRTAAEAMRFDLYPGL